MNNTSILDINLLWNPITFAVLAGLGIFLTWLAFMPAAELRDLHLRMKDYFERTRTPSDDMEMRKPITSRVIMPFIRKVLRFMGTFAPRQNIDNTSRMLAYAGDPGGMSAMDFYGVRLLVMLCVGGLCFLLTYSLSPLLICLRNSLILGILGYLLPSFWLRWKVRSRQWEIIRALPDALDMLTIGVEAGLAFESALLKVGERWNNALTREFRRVVTEMRIGTNRDVALQRMADRTGVQDVRAFIAILVQTNQLGVPIAQVLHAQAAQVRLKRRQRAEELARGASAKMAFPLVFCIFPAMFVVALGPGIPALLRWFSTIPSSGGLP